MMICRSSDVVTTFGTAVTVTLSADVDVCVNQSINLYSTLLIPILLTSVSSILFLCVFYVHLSVFFCITILVSDHTFIDHVRLLRVF